jgi:hypothetical protein
MRVTCYNFKTKGGEKYMKKILAIFVVTAFVLGLVGSVVSARTLEEERDAVRAYLKVVDAKIIKARTAGQKAKMVQLQKEKQGTLARWNKLKAQMEAGPTPPAPPPAPFAPVTPPPARAAVSAAPAAALFGLGINTAWTGSYVSTGKGSLSGSIGLSGDLILDDAVGLGPMVGLSANSVKYTVGLGGFYGGGGLKAIPVRAGGIIMLPADMMGGLETYISGGINYVVYGNSTTTGKVGGDVSVGASFDLGMGLGKTGVALGYSIVRSKTVSSKGLSLSVTQGLML